MSRAIGDMAAAFANQDSSGEPEVSPLAQAVKLLSAEEGLSKVEKAKLMLVAQKDIGFANLILSVEDVETRDAIYRLKLGEV